MNRLIRGSNGGFTLIEMIIVIAIISVLVGVVLTGVGGFQASARDTRRIGDMRNAQNFLELYFNKCNRYPGDENCGSANPANWDGLNRIMTTGANITSHFPSPLGSKSYYYGVSADGLQYVIGTELERDNGVLKDAPDGPVFGVPCSRTNKVYCVQS